MTMSLLVILDFSFSLEERNVEDFRHLSFILIYFCHFALSYVFYKPHVLSLVRALFYIVL